MVGRIEQVEKPGQFVTANVAGEPIVVVRGSDGVLRGFFNVCRHHAAAVVTEPWGQASILHCPYHGWNYGLDGSLKGMPEFEGVKNFERQQNGLNSVLDYKEYTIENEDRYCLQSSPMVSSNGDAATGAARKGDRAWYFWQYPNLMIDCYEGYMDTILVLPVDVDHCHVIF